MKLGVIFGSKSMEHEVSIVSASSIIRSLDKEKYEVFPIYLDRENNWYQVNIDPKRMKIYKLGDVPKEITPINNVFEYLKKLDVVFPVLHGKFGEDGTIQGMLELLGIPYVGCGIMASSVSLDKIYTKTLLSNHLNVVDDITLKVIDNKMFRWEKGKIDEEISTDRLNELIENNLKYPVFIKPSRYGSSVGIKKAHNKEELTIGLKEAMELDSEILLEKFIDGRELECAILLGKSTTIGEVKAADNFYSYEAKYTNNESKTIIPADIDEDICKKIKTMAEEAFTIINGKGLARIDFFLENKTNKLYINEINTMPGFTEISMYPKLVEDSGISYQKLLDLIIEDAKTNQN